MSKQQTKPKITKERPIGKGTCQECGGEYFKIDLWLEDAPTIRCSHCRTIWTEEW